MVIPTTVAEAVASLSERPDAVVLAGGTDLMVAVNEGHRRVGGDELVVCVNRIPELRSWTLDRAAGTLRLGAAVTYTELATSPLAGLVPALAQAARTVGSPQIRNAATLGGNVVTCSPAGDGLPVLAAVDATVELVSAEAVRQLPDRRVHDGGQADGTTPGGTAHHRHRAIARRLAGVRQGGRSERHGHRHLWRLPGS